MLFTVCGIRIGGLRLVGCWGFVMILLFSIGACELGEKGKC